MHELWRRIVFSICVSNTDDHLRNHGFLLHLDGWRLSPAYDINPAPTGTGLSLNISDADNSLNLDLALEVAAYFRLECAEDRRMLTGDLFINEIMADNDTIIEDPDEAGAFEDWVELFNAGTAAVDLSGMDLTDDVSDPTQWQFPAGSTIAAGGFLLIWADGEAEQGNDHASFKLSSGGETVALYSTDGTTPSPHSS